MSALVTLNQNELPVTTSLLVAETFKKGHDAVIKAIRKTKAECDESGISRVKIDERNYIKRGRKYIYFELNRKAFVMVAMGFTGKKALNFKSEYIDQFDAMEQHLKQVAVQRQTSQWNFDRIEGKMQRRKLTDIIAPFQVYAINQGSEGTAANAYSNFSRLVNKAAGVKAGERNLLTDDMLRRMAHLEGIIEIKIKELMGRGVYCKDIYQQCKTVLDNFVELVPYTGEVYLPKLEQLEYQEII